MDILPNSRAIKAACLSGAIFISVLVAPSHADGGAPLSAGPQVENVVAPGTLSVTKVANKTYDLEWENTENFSFGVDNITYSEDLMNWQYGVELPSKMSLTALPAPAGRTKVRVVFVTPAEPSRWFFSLAELSSS